MFGPMIVGAMVGGTASYLSILHHYRQVLGPMTVREARQLAAMPVTPIGHAREGFVKLVGTVGASAPVLSYYNRVPCAVLEWHHFEVVDRASGPQRVLVREEKQHQPFWVEDETGRVRLDPAFARIDFEVEGSDLESTIEERRIRTEGRVAVLGVVRRARPQLTQPMRHASTNFEADLEFVTPPLVTWRSEPEVYPRLAPPVGGLALSAGSVVMAVLSGMLNM